MKPRCIYEFGAFRLDATARVLLRGDEPVHLPRKAVETLLALVEHPGQVITREELMTTVWPDRVVDDANLAQNIAVVRKAIAAMHGEPGSIETFPGRGYRILGPVQTRGEIRQTTPASPVLVAQASAPVLGGRPEISTSTGQEAYATKTFQPGSVSGFRRIGILAAVIVVVALSSLAFLLPLSRERAGSAPEELHRLPVTRLAGEEHQPAISPDGKAVAFVWERPGETEPGIWLQYAWENSPRRITPEGGAYASPAWSPDGRRLAFLRFQKSEGAVMIASLDSNPPREVAQIFPTRHHLGYRHLDWLPDGRSLVVDDKPSQHEAFAIYEISLDNGERRRLTSPQELIVGDLEPRISPDGSRMSFIRMFHRAHQELFSLNLANGAIEQLTKDNRRVTGQDWLAGGTLAFGSDRGGEYRLWKMERLRGRAPHLRPSGIYADFPIQLSTARDVPALVYSILYQDLNIWRLDLHAGRDPASRWLRAIASSGLDASPQYSSRGDRVSFRSDRSGDEQLWVSDPDGGNAVQITKRGLRPSVGRWSPDGRSIVFNDASTREIYLGRLGADGNWNIVPLSGNGIHPVYSPDGRWIYAGRDEAIVRYPSEGGAAVEVAKTRGISLGVSPDGEYIYFVRDPSASALWRAQVSSGRIEMVFEGLVPYCSSCWAAGKKGIYYLGADATMPDRQVLRFHNLESRRETTVLEYPEPLNPIGSGPFSLSPDGRYLLCVRVGDSSGDVFRVEPFR